MFELQRSKLISAFHEVKDDRSMNSEHPQHVYLSFTSMNWHSSGPPTSGDRAFNINQANQPLWHKMCFLHVQSVRSVDVQPIGIIQSWNLKSNIRHYSESSSGQDVSVSRGWRATLSLAADATLNQPCLLGIPANWRAVICCYVLDAIRTLIFFKLIVRCDYDFLVKWTCKRKTEVDMIYSTDR
jgi:hypothetical protein